MTHEPRKDTWERARFANIVAGAALAAGTMLGGLWTDRPDRTETQISVTNTEATAATAPVQSSASGSPFTMDAPSNDGPMNLAPVPEPATSTVTKETEPSVAVLATPRAAKMTPRSATKHAKQSQAKTGDKQPRKTARLTIAVSPWGAIYIDGKLHGTTPPITTLDLSPGRHLVEVRNSSQPAYLTYATARAGEVRSIRHEFENGHEFR
jgi:PEGA domain